MSLSILSKALFKTAASLTQFTDHIGYSRAAMDAFLRDH